MYLCRILLSLIATTTLWLGCQSLLLSIIGNLRVAHLLALGRLADSPAMLANVVDELTEYICHSVIVILIEPVAQTSNTPGARKVIGTTLSTKNGLHVTSPSMSVLPK